MHLIEDLMFLLVMDWDFLFVQDLKTAQESEGALQGSHVQKFQSVHAHQYRSSVAFAGLQRTGLVEFQDLGLSWNRALLALTVQYDYDQFPGSLLFMILFVCYLKT